ncbi:MAG: DMT family transporter [Lachnospiraceae bacterium]|jgi:drug/metabolite transporter (DMT)-like permease|nr:DMT family transporter [Lachnospiraceae bacterium]
MKQGKNMHALAVAALLISAFFWASGYLFVKQAIEELSPYYLLSFRYVLAALLMLLIALTRLKHMSKELLKSGIFMGAALFLEFLTYTIGLQYTTVSRVSFIVAGYIIILPLVYLLIRRKAPKKQEILAAAVCMAGIACILAGGEGSMNKGDLFSIFCAISYAFHIVLGGKYAKEHDGILLNLMQIGTTAVLSTITALLFGTPPETVTMGQAGSIVYLALGGTILPYLLCLFGQKYVSTTTSGIILSFESVFATMMSIIFLHETISLQFAVGGALVIGAFFVSEWNGNQLKIKKENL